VEEDEDQSLGAEDGDFDELEDAPGSDPAAVQATLGNVASGLAEQLSSITEEMNKIRQELYGEGGIGGIAKELDKLKDGGLGSLLDGAGLSGLGGGALGGGGGLAGLAGVSSGPSGSSSLASASTSASASASASSSSGGSANSRLRPSEAWDVADGDSAEADASSAADAAAAKARRRRTPEERDRELEELRRKLMARGAAAKPSQNSAAKSGAGVSMWEKLVLLFLVLVCLYVGSPFFRSSVKTAVSAALFGEAAEGWEAEGEDGEIEPDY